jgi:hypothetical protein
MAVSGYEPSPLDEPQTEAVRSGRRAAVVVAVVAVLVVGLFIWKPWQGGPTPTATARGSFAAVVSPTPRPTTVASTAIRPAPLATDAPVATPDVSSSQGQIVAPKNLGFVSLPPDDRGTFVYCVYGTGRDTSGLVTMIVNPPVVTTGTAARGLIKRINFRPEIEVNSQEGLFSAGWRYLGSGNVQRSKLDASLVSLFKSEQLKVDVTALPASALLRISIVINWIDSRGNRYADLRVYPAAYAPLGDAQTDPVAEGCPARN